MKRDEKEEEKVILTVSRHSPSFNICGPLLVYKSCGIVASIDYL